MRSLFKFSGGRFFGSRSFPCREAGASDRPPVFLSAQTLEAAIGAATFVRREPDEDGERVIVLCPELGGSFIYSREEAERRILLKYPSLAFEEVTAGARYLENRLRAWFEPQRTEQRQKSSWTFGWRGDY